LSRRGGGGLAAASAGSALGAGVVFICPARRVSERD
jgi:hypothetical protein